VGGRPPDRRGHNPVTVRKWFTIAGFSIACTELIGARASSLETALIFAVVSLSAWVWPPPTTGR